MKKFCLLLLLTFLLVQNSKINAQIISQYVETESGATPKGIEIWNNTGVVLDFSTNVLSVNQGTNGALPNTIYSIVSGTLDPGKVIVVGTSDMQSIAENNGASFFQYTFTFNGDDALTITYGGTITDVFGVPGVDPGSAWSGNGVSTANQNIQLLSSITAGDIDGWTDPSLRFEVVSLTPSTDLSGFGISPGSVVTSLKVIPNSLNNFSYVVDNGPSTSQSYVLSGSNLDGSDVTITAPADYEVSEDNTNWFSNITLTSYDGSNTTVYVRLKSGLSTGDYNNETITNSGGGATTQNVTVSGSVTPASVLAVSPSTLSNFTYVYGAGPSVSQSYELSGSGLTPESGNITITGLTNYEVSTDNSTFNNSVDVAYTGGELSATNIYVRLKAGLNTGSYNNEMIANSGGGATTKDVTVSGAVTPPVFALPMVENFDYLADSYLTENGWFAHSGAGTNPIKVNNYGLVFSGYESSGIGYSALVNNNGEDVSKLIDTVSTGAVYYSFLINVQAVVDGYFIHLGKSSSTFAARVFVKSSTIENKINFGISNTSTANYNTTPTEFDLSTTYLIIVKYDISTSDASLWVFASNIPNSELEAGTPECTASGSGIDIVDRICLRQYNASQNFVIDGIRVATSWNEAPLPVEMTSFTASVSGSAVTLKWRTETESNNYGFEVQRKLSSNIISDWKRIGFVQGNGNSNLANEYSYTDNLSVLGKYCYRLKQMDNDGSASYSKTVEVNLGTPNKYELDQNYPNPFNPNTNIKFKLPLSGNVKIIVYNLIGQEVKVLLNEFKEAGEHIINFTADGLNSGVYIYRIEANGFTEARKMTLLK